MPLDPAAQQLLDLITEAGEPPLEEMTPAQAREVFAGLAPLQGEAPPVASIEEREIAGVRCQVITPGGPGPWPVLIWIHGGGWVIGSAAEMSVTAQRLSVAADCVVVNVDYRLAPEHPFPAAPDDCVTVARWVLAHADEIGGDAARVAVGGDSAGGNLSAVVANEVPGLVFQLLVYPVTDLSTMSRPSYEENADGYLLTKAGMEWFAGHYLASGADPRDARISPLLSEADVLAGAPPTFVVSAEFDPLRDEGEAYASRLTEAGVPTTLTRYDGEIHAFYGLAAMIPASLDAIEESATHLRKAFAAH